MNQSLKETKIKNKPTDSTSSDQMKISSEMQLNLIKQERDCLVQSEIHIKTEPKDTANEFPVIASTSYNMCQSYYMKFETNEMLIKIECEGMVDALMQDPLDIGCEIKDEEHFPNDLDEDETRIKTEPTKGEKDNNPLEFYEDDSQDNDSNQSQDQLLIRNDSDHNDKKHICHVCNKTFTLKWILITHLRIHTGEKPFTCDICNKSFSQKVHLNNHMRIHSGLKPHTCEVCMKVFNQKSTLNSHKLIHSGVKKFSCDVCEKSFTQKTSLIRHKRIHTGEKPYTCDLCKKEFTVKSNLVTHIRLHAGEKPFSCNVCTKSFAQKSHLNTHKKIHKN